MTPPLLLPPPPLPPAATTALWSSTPTTTTTIIPATTTSPYPYSPTSGPDQPTECRLLGSFAILVQLALGALALLSLVYKRWRERPQRPVRIWFFDVSKQVFGSALVHAANVFMSLLTSGSDGGLEMVDAATVSGVGVGVGVVVRRLVAAGLGVGVGTVLGRRDGGGGGGEEYVPNPCSFYLLNLGIDTTLGIPILIVIVRVLTRLVAFTPLGNPPESIQSGNYGNPPNAWWWLKQSLIYFCGLMGMKLCVLVIFMMFPWLPHVGDWALGWTEGNEKLQIVFVMMLFPLIMNALQYYIIDSYIKLQQSGPEDGEAGAGGGVCGTVVYEELLAEETEDSGEDDEDRGGDIDARKGINSAKGPHLRLARRHSADARSSRDLEYDPAVDGDTPTVVGSSSSSRRALPKELLPPE